jgi:hypothetical protein
MKRKVFKTENSIGHIETNEEDDEPQSGNPLYPPGIKVEGVPEYFPPVKEFPDNGSGGALFPPGIEIKENE